MTAALAAAIVPQCAVALKVSLEGKRLTLGFIAAMVLVVLGGVTASGIQFGDLQFVWGFLIGLCTSSFFAWGSRATVKEFPALQPLARTTVTNHGMTGFCAFVFFGILIFKMSGTTNPMPTTNDFICF